MPPPPVPGCGPLSRARVTPAVENDIEVLPPTPSRYRSGGRGWASSGPRAVRGADRGVGARARRQPAPPLPDRAEVVAGGGRRGAGGPSPAAVAERARPHGLRRDPRVTSRHDARVCGCRRSAARPPPRPPTTQHRTTRRAHTRRSLIGGGRVSCWSAPSRAMAVTTARPRSPNCVQHSDLFERFVEQVRWATLCEEPMRYSEPRYAQLWAQLAHTHTIGATGAAA